MARGLDSLYAAELRIFIGSGQLFIEGIVNYIAISITFAVLF
jgi:hypothetical protein